MVVKVWLRVPLEMSTKQDWKKFVLILWLSNIEPMKKYTKYLKL